MTRSPRSRQSTAPSACWCTEPAYSKTSSSSRKPARASRKVYAPKVAGLRNLLEAVDRDALRALVLFSSSTARYGRAGQVDYAIANEVLNKLAKHEALRLPGCKVMSLNWGPWEGGMVDPSLRTVFANEGVPLIPLAQGADHLLRELASDETAVERLVLGPALAGAPNLTHSQELTKSVGKEPSVSSALPLVAEEQIDVASCSFLRSHVLDGKAVVPHGNAARVARSRRTAWQPRSCLPRLRQPQRPQGSGPRH